MTPSGAARTDAELVGRVQADDLDAFEEFFARYGPWIDHDFFVSGSPTMVKSTLRTLAELQVPPLRIRYDALSEH